MKRVKAACICQTLHFMLQEDAGHDYAVKQVKEEVAQYKKTLERNHTQYRITEDMRVKELFAKLLAAETAAKLGIPCFEQELFIGNLFF